MCYLFQCRLIVGTMCYQRCERFNHLLYPLIVLVLVVPFLHGGAEYIALVFYTVIVAVAHLHYGISVVSKTFISLKYLLWLWLVVLEFCHLPLFA